MARPKAQEQVREARTELYRKLIIAAAEREFAAHGFDAARMQHVAKDAALSVGTLYGIFSSKLELYTGVHQVRGGELIRRVAAVLHEGDAMAAIERGIDAYVRFYVDHPMYLRMQLREGTAWALSQDQSEEIQETWRAGIGMVAAVCRRGIEAGVLDEEDPMRMAKTLTAIHQVQLAHWVEHEPSEPPESLVERLRESFRRLYVKPASRR